MSKIPTYQELEKEVSISCNNFISKPINKEDLTEIITKFIPKI